MNKIERKNFEGDFNSLVLDIEEFSYRKHRRGSTFYTKAIIKINKEWFPELDEKYYGTWETNEFIDCEEDRVLSEIHTLYRVKLVEKTIVIQEYQKVENICQEGDIIKES